jgi:hypothetical protein
MQPIHRKTLADVGVHNLEALATSAIAEELGREFERKLAVANNRDGERT